MARGEVSLGFQQYTVLWTASAWYQGHSSFAWFVLAAAASFAYDREPRRRHGWAVLVGTYGCLTSGWPLAIPVLGLLAGTR